MDATPRMLRWETLTKTQFDEIDPKETVVVLTCSPIEVHGPHLPLGADAFEGELGPEEWHSPLWKLRLLFLNPLLIRLTNRLIGFRNAIA